VIGHSCLIFAHSAGNLNVTGFARRRPPSTYGATGWHFLNLLGQRKRDTDSATLVGGGIHGKLTSCGTHAIGNTEQAEAARLVQKKVLLPVKSGAAIDHFDQQLSAALIDAHLR
jgi:hypothetical protein